MKYYKSKVKYVRLKDDTFVNIYFKTDGKTWWDTAVGVRDWYELRDNKLLMDMEEISKQEAFLELL